MYVWLHHLWRLSPINKLQSQQKQWFQHWWTNFCTHYMLHVNQSALVKRIKLTLAHFMAQCLYARWCIKGLICRFRPERTSMELWFYLSSAYQGVSELRQKTIFYMKTTCGEGGGWAQTPAGGGLEHVDFVYLFKWNMSSQKLRLYMVEGTVREACATFFCYCILHLEGQDSASFLPLHPFFIFSPKCPRCSRLCEISS